VFDLNECFSGREVHEHKAVPLLVMAGSRRPTVHQPFPDICTQSDVSD